MPAARIGQAKMPWTGPRWKLMPCTGSTSGANTSMSGAFAPSRQAAIAKRERRFSPIWPMRAPASV